MRAFAILLLGAALAGCGSEPAKPAPKSVREVEVQQAAATRAMTGWDKVFAAPIETVGAINQAGFGLADYATSGTAGAHRAEGIKRLMSGSTAPSPNFGSAAVSGSQPDRLDQISFVLELNDPAGATAARDRFAQVLGEFLDRVKVSGGAAVTDAVRRGENARPQVDGIPAAVTATATRIDVTFLRPAASAGASKS